MVLFETAEGYHKGAMEKMAEWRTAEMSDVTIRAKGGLVYAHRCVLAAESVFFRTMFASSFSDSKTREIDLTSVTEEEDIIEMLVSFIYTGRIEFEEEHFWTITRLACYFEMKTLMEFCESRFKEIATITNCLEIFSFARACGYRSIGWAMNEVIEYRWRDYFLQQSEMLELQPEDMESFLPDPTFRFCLEPDFIEFIAKWVIRGNTKRHLTVAKELMEQIKERHPYEEDNMTFNLPVNKNVLQECYKNLEVHLKQIEFESEKEPLVLSFLNEFQEVVCLYSEEKEITFEDKENVLLTVSKRVKDNVLIFLVSEEENQSGSKTRETKNKEKENKNDVFDICLYRPKTKLWYHLDQLDKETQWHHLDQLDKEIQHLRYGWYSPFWNFLHEEGTDNYSCSGSENTVIFSKPTSSLMYDIQKKEGKRLPAKPKPAKKKNNDDPWFLWDIDLSLNCIGEHFSVQGDTVFGIFITPLKDDDYYYEEMRIQKLEYQVCKMPVNGTQFTEVMKFEREILPRPFKAYVSTDSYYNDKRKTNLKSSLHFKVSCSGEEMLVLSYIQDPHEEFEFQETFLVNIVEETVHFFPHEKVTKELAYPFQQLSILETDNSFLIVWNQVKDSIDEQLIAIYKFNSKDIVFCEGRTEISKIFEFENEYWWLPHARRDRTTSAFPGECSLMIFRKNYNYANMFWAVPFTSTEHDNGHERELIAPPPPPFDIFICGCETRLDHKFLDKLEPVTGFLFQKSDDD